jgi:fibronectin-binding autotransporter adhesin
VFRAAALAVPAILAGAGLSANAASLTWGVGGAGGSGNWDGSTGAANWFNGTSNVKWSDATPDSGTFAGAAGGTVTLTGARTAGGLTFTTDGYTLTGNTLDLGTTSSVTVNAGLTAAIDSQLTGGSSVLVKDGDGTLNLTNNGNDYGGGTVLNAGILNMGPGEHTLGALPGAAGTNVTFNGGTLQWGGNYSLDSFRSLQVNAGGGTIDTNGFDSTVGGFGPAITGSGTLTKTGGGNFKALQSNTSWTGKLIVTGNASGAGWFVTNNENGLPHPTVFTPDAVTLMNGGAIFPNASKSTGQNISVNSNLGLTVGTGGGQLVSGLNQTVITWNGSLSAPAGTTLDVNYGTYRFTSDLTNTTNNTTFAGTLRVNGAGSGGGRIILDGHINNNQANFAWGPVSPGVGPTGDDQGVIQINSENPNITGTFPAALDSGRAILIAGPGTTHAFGDGSATNILEVSNGATIGGGMNAVIPQDIHFTNGLTLRGDSGNPGGNPDNTISRATIPWGDTVTFTGLITGTGNFVKGNSPSPPTFTTVILTHTGNSWDGSTSGAGDLVVGGNEVLPGGTHLTLGGGTGKQFTVLAPFTQTLGGITSSGVMNIDGTLILGGDNTNSNESLSHGLNGSGTIVKVGAGDFALSGDNSFIYAPSGVGFNGTWKIQSGRVSFGDTNTMGQNTTGAGFNVVLDGGTLRLDNNGTVHRPVSVTANGGFIEAPSFTAPAIDGEVSGSGLLAKTGPGTLTLSHANTLFTGGVSINDGVLQVSASNNLGDGSATNQLELGGGALQFGAGFSANRNVNLAGAGGTIDVQAFSSSVNDITRSGTGANDFTKAGTGTLTANSVHAGIMNVSAGKMVIAPNGTSTGTSVVSALTIAGASDAWTSQLDVKDNDIIVHSDNANRVGQAASITNQLKQGSNFAVSGQFWTGNGIITSLGGNGSTSYTAVGVAVNDFATLGGAQTGPIYSTFDGENVGVNDVLVKYTYFGDADLDGAVTTNDYFQIDNGFLNSRAGWINGDFDYDGAVTTNDYFLIDNAFLGQGGALVPAAVGSAEPLSGVTAVPEPASLGVLAFAAAGLLGRRRRR